MLTRPRAGGGTIIDGSGAPRFAGDVAVDGDKITAVGAVPGTGKREIDATGKIVQPGWVDIHTHYDGQCTWDPWMTPSSYHGVTTAVFGNCGVGFAPVRPGQHPWLINLMEGVEDIPGSVLNDGIEWGRWETFPEYMDVIEETPRVMDIGCQIPHGALRFYVMGDRGADHSEEPSREECELMKTLVKEGLDAGALGFTTARTIKHRARDGRITPGYSAHDPEMEAIAEGMRDAGAGLIEANMTDVTAEDDFMVMRRMSEISGRPLTILLLQIGGAPELWEITRQQIRDANAAGITATGQVGCRPVGNLQGWENSGHPFIRTKAWREELAPLPIEERFPKLKADKALQEAMLAEHVFDPEARWRSTAVPDEGETPEQAAWAMQDYVMKMSAALMTPAGLNYEPDLSTESMAARAAAGEGGGNPYRVAMEYLLENDGKNMLIYPIENYAYGDLEVIRELLEDEHTIAGLGDAGAHVGNLADGSCKVVILLDFACCPSR